MGEAVVGVVDGVGREAEVAPRARARRHGAAARPSGALAVPGARTCVGCGERVPPAQAADLVRLVLGPDGEIAVDPRGGAFGRGVHVHARPACLDRAVRGGLARSTKGRAVAIVGGDRERRPLSADALGRAIEEAMSRRLVGLLANAFRSRQLSPGGSGDAHLWVVAGDAPAAAPAVARALASGRVVRWADAARLGALVGVGDAPVLGVRSPRLAEAVRAAAQITEGCIAVGPVGVQQGRAGGRRERRAATEAPRAPRAQDFSRRRLSGVGSNVERGE